MVLTYPVIEMWKPLLLVIVDTPNLIELIKKSGKKNPSKAVKGEETVFALGTVRSVVMK